MNRQFHWSRPLLARRAFVAMVASVLLMPMVALAQENRPAVSKSTGMKFNCIPAGGFEMGSLTSEEGHTRSEIQHTTRISQPFYLGVTEVTQEEYQTIMESNPSAFSRHGTASEVVAGMATRRFPVENVSWYDTIEFCNRLSEKDNFKPYYGLTGIEREHDSIKSAVVTILGGGGYRLPTEAEWEYACRAGTTTAYNSGDTVSLLEDAGWFGSKAEPGNSDRQTHRVGQKGANSFGLFDMHGNVSEWCQDWYDYSSYERSPTQDPQGPSGGSMRVVRGGSWSEAAVHCRSAQRGGVRPMQHGSSTGFRVARSAISTRPTVAPPAPPFRIVLDLRDGGTVDVFNNETYDSIDSAKQRLQNSKLFGRIDSLRIIDNNGKPVE
jgi:sulfatase modifying factor 1